MYTWEQPFIDLVTSARKMELKFVLKTGYIRCVHLTTMLFTTRMALFCTMLSITWIYGSEYIVAAKIFVIAAYFTILSHTKSHFVRGVSEIADVLVAFKRIQHFLLLDEKTNVKNVEKVRIVEIFRNNI